MVTILIKIALTCAAIVVATLACFHKESGAEMVKNHRVVFIAGFVVPMIVGCLCLMTLVMLLIWGDWSFENE